MSAGDVVVLALVAGAVCWAVRRIGKRRRNGCGCCGSCGSCGAGCTCGRKGQKEAPVIKQEQRRREEV